MSLDRLWKTIEPIFEQALEIEPERRQEFIEKACKGDAESIAAVERLLAADAETDGIIDRPVGERAGTLMHEAAEQIGENEAPGSGERFGPYRVLEEIGSGGMSRVYLAERVDGTFDHQVALKLMRRLGGDAAERRRRFLQETRLLGSLTHPWDRADPRCR